MRISDLDKSAIFLDLKMEAVIRELIKYRHMAYFLLEAEAVGKIRRYGRDYYEKNYLRNPNENYSDFMKTFLYLKSTEEQLFAIKEDIQSKIKK